MSAIAPGFDPTSLIFYTAQARQKARAAFGYALVVSAIVHTLLVLFVPGFRSPLPDLILPERLDVVLAPPPAAEVAPPPEPVSPPPQPEPQIKETKPVPKKEAPKPVPRREERIITAPPETTTAAPSVPEPPAPAPAPEPAPVAEVPKAPAPPPVSETRPTQPVIEAPTDEMKSNWGAKFKAAIDQMRRYPRLAQQRGWQGTVTLMVHFAPGGKLSDVNVLRSSGFEVLDEAAKEMVRSAQLPPMSDSLRQHGFDWRVPVEFRLES